MDMTTLDTSRIEYKLQLLVRSFSKILYEEDTTFLENMKSSNLAADDISRYRFWEWTQGVGLYGLWKLYERNQDPGVLSVLTTYYDTQLANGLPSKNINTVAPLLTLSFLYPHTGKPEYLAVCKEWAEWIMNGLPRTQEGGFQHITSDTVNDQELWDDTLFMTVLFLANMGKLLNKPEYVKEAEYQFLLHAKYLSDKYTGLWYHGWTFNGAGNFAKAFWGRGNCWVTIAIPTFIAMVDLSPSVSQYLTGLLKQQADSLVQYQSRGGMWHTLLDDKDSYLESSASAGFGYGILLGVHQGLLDESFKASAMKALIPVLDCIDSTGIMHQVSYGTPMGRITKDFYKTIPIQPMPYGQALAILFLLEGLEELEASEQLEQAKG